MLTMLPKLPGFEIIDAEAVNQQYLITAKAAVALTACPLCGELTDKVHSWYKRKPQDLPSVGVAVRLFLQVRRFFCPNTGCRRKVFCERLPKLIRVYARQTIRLAESQVAIAIELAGQAGRRLATKLSMQASRDTLLRAIRRQPDLIHSEPVAIGIDDWAYRKRHTYGTLICDHETGRVIDLLSDRQPETVSRWLTAHPTIQFVTRDRSQSYAAGIAAGAPTATQIADRWHLSHNLVEALELTFAKYPQVLKGGHSRRTQEVAREPVSAASGKQTLATDRNTASVASRERRLSKYNRLVELRQQGVPIATAAAQAGVGYSTACRWIAHGSFPERRPNSKRKRTIDPYADYLDQRWREGNHKSKWLYYEIRAQGYAGSYVTVNRYCAELALRLGGKQSTATACTVPTSRPPCPKLPPPRRSYSSRQAAFLLIRPRGQLTDEQREDLDAILEENTQFRPWRELALRFMALLRNRDVRALDPWLADAARSGSGPLKRFAAGLRRDYAEVLAALRYKYSNGAAEGHINKLKFLKRQMFGRAKFDLLRKRVLYLS